MQINLKMLFLKFYTSPCIFYCLALERGFPEMKNQEQEAVGLSLRNIFSWSLSFIVFAFNKRND